MTYYCVYSLLVNIILNTFITEIHSYLYTYHYIDFEWSKPIYVQKKFLKGKKKKVFFVVAHSNFNNNVMWIEDTCSSYAYAQV